MNSKIYRCGHCGQPVDKNAKPLEGESFERVCRILDEYGDHRTHKKHGKCCAYEEKSRMVQVTWDMASDAGDPNLEGEWINW
jgi:CRISPR/Cas system-associated protein Cas10 (large subunit of type III CRISPR-Cas system)